MSIYAPLGINWMDFHAERMFNAVEFLRLNGFNEFGFTIWSLCTDCVLEEGLKEGIYYSSLHAINMSPYVLINILGGKESLLFWGPMLDKFIVFICAMLVAEIMIKSIKVYTRLPVFFIGTACFSLFSLSPWAYKIFVGGWWEIYFVMFFLLGLLAFEKGRFKLGLLSFLVASFAQSIWGSWLGIFYILLAFLPYFFKGYVNSSTYFPFNIKHLNQKILIITVLILPQVLFAVLKVVAMPHVDFGTSSSLFFRMGISGEDIHNGGLIGALQFLGGSRLTQCFGGAGSDIFSSNSMALIAMYNCTFSIVGMAIISLLSVVGVYLLVKSSTTAAKFFLPLIFSMLMFIGVFQQSLSTHLMGYSFIFAVLFSVGITKMMILLQDRSGSNIMGLIFSIPCLAGILILSIRVSMLSSIS